MIENIVSKKKPLTDAYVLVKKHKDPNNVKENLGIYRYLAGDKDERD